MNKGFSLIEILVLLVIIGIVTVGITPRVIERKLGVNPVIKFYTEIVDEHLQLASDLGRPVFFKGFLGSGNILKMDGKRVTLPGSITVQDAFVGGVDEPGLEYNVFVYPSGMVDYFELRLSDGTVVESIPLLTTVRFQSDGGGYTGTRPAYR